MKNTILITLLFFFSLKSFAQSTQIVIDLQSLNLTESTVQTDTSATGYTEAVLKKIRISDSPSKEGVGEIELKTQPRQVYSTGRLIEKALEEAQLLPIGEKINHFEESVKKILKNSGNRRHEIIVRMTLNRAVDTMNTILPIAGNNPEEVARFVANFYTEAFNLARGFATNQFHVQSVITFNQFYRNNLYIIEYGRMMATLMYRFSMSANLSDSAKGVMLIKLLGYLGWDAQLDLRSREQAVRELIGDIYLLQTTNQNLKRILEAIDSQMEPSTVDVNRLRGQVFKITQQLPAVISRISTP